MRTFDVDDVIKATEQCRKDLTGFNPEEWLACHSNVALMINSDLALFERELPGVVTGHYFFESRGKAALASANEILQEAFSGDYDIRVIRGLSPLEKLGARWMNRQLGFTSYGVVQTVSGPCELVILTKEEYNG